MPSSLSGVSLTIRWLNLEPDSDFVIADDVAEWTVWLWVREKRMQLVVRLVLMVAIWKKFVQTTVKLFGLLWAKAWANSKAKTYRDTGTSVKIAQHNEYDECWGRITCVWDESRGKMPDNPESARLSIWICAEMCPISPQHWLCQRSPLKILTRFTPSTVVLRTFLYGWNRTKYTFGKKRHVRDTVALIIRHMHMLETWILCKDL